MRLVIPIIALLLLAPVHVAAQGTIRPGEVREGELTRDDPALDSGVHYDVWRFRAEAGHLYLVYLSSETFDAYAAVGTRVAPECQDCVESDDDAGGTDALVQFVPATSGTYEIRAGSYGPGETGRYELMLEDHGESTADTVLVIPGTDTVWAAVDTAVIADSAAWAFANEPWYEGPHTPPMLFPGVLEARGLEGGLNNEHGERYHEWAYFGAAGETITVRMESSDFDTMLRIRLREGEEWRELASDDDGGGGTNSAVTLTLPRNAAYVVQAAGFSEGEGGYVISATTDGVGFAADTVVTTTMLPYPSVPVSADSFQAPPTPLQAGETVQGELHETDRQATETYTYFDAWSYRGRAGETVVIRMRSDDFDTEVRVGRARDGGWEELDGDDDGGEGTNSELTFTFPDDGEYEIHARALFPGDTGRYTLSVERP